MPSPLPADRGERPGARAAQPSPATRLRAAHPTLPPDAADMLAALLAGMRATLGDDLVGVYLRGSLATGDFDPATSDLDFFAVTERPVTAATFAALRALHAQLDRRQTRYAGELEGPYFDRAAARRFRPGERHPTIGRGEALAWTEHGANWALERWTVRERGLILLGPDPRALIDAVTPDELRTAVRARLGDWLAWAGCPDDPNWLGARSHQTYVVETMCRVLFTLACGALTSKPRAVAWALADLPEPWRTTVARSRAWHGDSTADPATVPEVLRFVRWVAARAAGEEGDAG
jgi:hypothetical protein